MSDDEPRRRRVTISRDTVMFTVGLGLVVFEAVVRSGEPRATLIALYAAMMGLPFVLAADVLRRGDDKKDGDT